jgi:hypothetical protein
MPAHRPTEQGYLSTKLILGVCPVAQRAVSAHVARRRQDALPSSLQTSSLAGQKAHTRMLSCAGRLASAWLQELPVGNRAY